MWGKVRTVAKEIAFQTVLRKCSKEVVGRSQYTDFGEGGIRAVKHIFLAEGFC